MENTAMRPVYVALRGASVLSVHDFYHEASGAAQGPTARVEVRRGTHPRWTDRAWWRDFEAHLRSMRRD